MKALFAAIAFSVFMSGGAASAADIRPLIEVRQGMRALWEDHISYTHRYIVSELADLPDKDAVTNRLFKNQEDLGNMIKPYYGEIEGDKFTALLKEHVLLAMQVAKDSKTGDKTAVANDRQRWLTNAEKIALLLGNMNPNWRTPELPDLWLKHIGRTTDGITARLERNWQLDIASYDANHEHILVISDLLTAGLARQYPERFAQR